jgi:SAM-dependent methyltransferase
MYTVLNVGCGPRLPNKLNQQFRSADWREIRLDIDPNVDPDVVGSVTDLSMLATHTLDAIWSSHNLEHLHDHEVEVALAEFRRVLRPTGFLLMRLPDLQAIAALIANGDVEKPLFHLARNGVPFHPITPLDVLYGCRLQIAEGRHYMAHKTGFTHVTLGKRLHACGFPAQLMARTPDTDLWVMASGDAGAINEAWFRSAITPLPTTA